MLPLENATKKILVSENLVAAGETVLVAVSGGPDSMALLHVLAGLAGDLQLTLAAAHADHGLRPAETEQEKFLVEKEAEKLGITCHTATLAVKQFARDRKSSIAEAARILRYAFLQEAAEECGAAKIALAHTGDDQAEELLLRLIRGTGRKGLSGMKPLRAGTFIRPFLNFPKNDLLKYLARKKIPFCTDSSNTSRKYLRNRVRLDLLPFLKKKFNPSISKTLLQTTWILQEEESLLEELAREAMARTAAKKKADLLLDLETFSTLHKAIQRRVLETACWQMESRPAFRQIEQLLAIIRSAIPGKNLHLGTGLRVSKSGGALQFSHPQGKKPLRGNLAMTEKNKSFELAVPKPGTYKIQETGSTVIIEQLKKKPGKEQVTADKSVEYLDCENISFPLVLRSPRPGDRFQPLGNPGSRKVSDFLTDRKVAKIKRWEIPVLLSGETILALIGQRIDHRYRITDKTRNILKISWQEK